MRRAHHAGMAVWRTLICLIVSLALVGGGLTGRVAMAAGSAGTNDSAPTAAAEPCPTMTAAEPCPGCDDSCPASQMDCATSCTIAAPPMALAAASAPLPAVLVRIRGESAERFAVGRDPPPDPFPPRL
ncbi:MAG TPA: hypothetical protein VJ890_24055 [Vineibacter sp.]|nr:hypothetical protein [Vineibacter sp.]